MELERLNQDQFSQFRDFIYQKSGIRVDEKKISLLSNRIRRRLKAKDLSDFDVYYRYLTSPAGTTELEFFLDAITTNETFFFRTGAQFDWLRSDFLEGLICEHQQGRHPASLRVWSAGCASGAEPYSIAISIEESRHRMRDWNIEILGTDISEEALREARQGCYKARSVEAVTDAQRSRYFNSRDDGDTWQLRQMIRDRVKFENHNLMQAAPGRDFDCIFIRNVLIYFDRESKQVVVKHLIDALAKGGFLVVGPSEGVYDMLEPLQKVSPLMYQKVTDRR